MKSKHSSRKGQFKLYVVIFLISNDSSLHKKSILCSVSVNKVFFVEKALIESQGYQNFTWISQHWIFLGDLF